MLESVVVMVTREELREELARYPTREEMRETLREELARYPTRVEMRETLREELARYPTREEMRETLREELARYPTREELQIELSRFATKQDLERFATKVELQELRGETAAGFADLRRYMEILYDDLKGTMQTVLETLLARIDGRGHRVDAQLSNHENRIAGLELRVTGLERTRRG